MEKKKKLKRNNSIIIIVIVNIILNGCTFSSNKYKDNNCSTLKKIRESMITNIDLSTIDKVFLKVYSKNTSYKNEISTMNNSIFSKALDADAKNWNFNLTDSIDVNYDYQVCFISKTDTFKFRLSSLTIGKWDANTNQGPGSICTLIKYNIDGVNKVDAGNIEFIKN